MNPYNTISIISGTMFVPATVGAWLAGKIRDDTPSGGTSQRVRCTFIFIGVDDSGSTPIPIVGTEEIALTAGATGILISGDESTGPYGNKIRVP